MDYRKQIFEMLGVEPEERFSDTEDYNDRRFININHIECVQPLKNGCYIYTPAYYPEDFSKDPAIYKVVESYEEVKKMIEDRTKYKAFMTDKGYEFYF